MTLEQAKSILQKFESAREKTLDRMCETDSTTALIHLQKELMKIDVATAYWERIASTLEM